MRRSAVLPLIALAAACSEVASERPAPTAESVARVAPAPAAAPDTIPRPAAPVDEAAEDGVSVTHAVHPSLPHHHFTLLPAGDGAIRAIRVRAVGDARAHELPVSESAVGEHFPLAERVMVQDLDFDGYADLGFVTGTGATGNAWADYWRFDPAARRFVAVGTHSVFQVDSAARQLRARNKGGHAGLLFTDETYRWIDGQPVVVRVEEQDSDASGEGYVRTVRELRDGQLVETERRVMTREEAVAEMERG